MKPIIVQDQVKLGPRRCLQLAMAGMGYRMFRSAVTVSILSLAVAFMVQVLAHSLLASHVTQQAYDELGSTRDLNQWVARLTAPDTDSVVTRSLNRDMPRRHTEYQRWAQLNDAELAQAREDAAAVASLGAYFDTLIPASRAVLTGGQDTLAVAAALNSPREFELFNDRLKQLKLHVLNGDQAAFENLVQVRVPRLMAVISRVQQGHRQAIEKVRQAMGNVPPLELLAEPPTTLDATLRDAGFAVEAGELPALASLAGIQRDIDRLGRDIQPREIKNLVARKLGQPVALVTPAIVVNWINSQSNAQWLAETIRKAGGTPLPPERMALIADHYRRTQRLAASLGDSVPSDDPGFLGLTTSTMYLIGLSFLVCAVGVANAMLMSVTERFSEIATMKCLGAMDGFVMLMFVFEAMLQGLFGGAIGVLLGLLLALLRGLVEYGGLIFGAGDVLGQLLLGGLISLVAGIGLAVVAAVWPAWVASRLAPMEAMRVE